MAAKKNTAESDKPMTKSGFIKGLGIDMSADEIVAKGKEAGLDLDKKYVWTLQSEMRKATGGGTGKMTKRSAKKLGKKAVTVASSGSANLAGAAAPKKKYGFKNGTSKAAAPVAAAASKANGGSSAEHKMKALIVELGTARAEEIYRAVRTQLNTIVGQA